MSSAPADLAGGLEALYRAYNRRRFVHPDPLEFLYLYPAPEDQEIVGLVSACLAYGRVTQILASVVRVLEMMKDGSSPGSPRAWLETARPADITARLESFAHRFTTGAEMAALLVGIKRAVARHGTLERLFAGGAGRGDETTLPALAAFVADLRALSGGPCPSLLSSPADGSACKRLNLFLRWMSRKDAVDPGPWAARLPRERLVVPLDTHLFRIAGALRMTSRRQADLKTALEVTDAFRSLRPRDPVRYDFALTRLGIRRGRDDGEPPAHRLECDLIAAAGGPRRAASRRTAVGRLPQPQAPEK